MTALNSLDCSVLPNGDLECYFRHSAITRPQTLIGLHMNTPRHSRKCECINKSLFYPWSHLIVPDNEKNFILIQFIKCLGIPASFLSGMKHCTKVEERDEDGFPVLSYSLGLYNCIEHLLWHYSLKGLGPSLVASKGEPELISCLALVQNSYSKQGGYFLCLIPVLKNPLLVSYPSLLFQLCSRQREEKHPCMVYNLSFKPSRVIIPGVESSAYT